MDKTIKSKEIEVTTLKNQKTDLNKNLQEKKL